MDFKEKIREVWEHVLEKEDFKNDDSIMDIGGDSLKIYKISRILQEKHGLEISPMDIMMFPTVLSMVSFLEKKRSESEVDIETIRPVKRNVRKK